MSLERITLTSLPPFTGLNEESVIAYFQAEHTFLPLLKNRVTGLFTKLLKANTGFNDENLPPETTATELKLGDITFTVLSEKRKKRPALGDVYQGLLSHLVFLLEGHQENIRRKGVINIEGRPYIPLQEIFSRLEELKAEVDANEVKQSLSHNYQEGFEGNLVVPLAYDLSLTAADALTYVRGEALEKLLKGKTIQPLEKALKEGTGYSREHVPEKMISKWVQIGSHLFEVQSIPENTPKYADLFSDLTKEAPEKLTSRSRYGELIAVRDSLPLDQGTMEHYRPRTREGEVYVSLRGAIERLIELKKIHTNPSLNQKIFYYPAI